MFEKYTEAARRVIFFSRLEALEHGATQISTEHLLCALLRCQARPLVLALVDRGLTIEAVQQAVDQVLPVHVEPEKGIDVPLDSAAMSALQFASEESRLLGDAHLGPEHLLLGLLREPGGLGGTILLKHGITRADIHAVIARARA